MTGTPNYITPAGWQRLAPGRTVRLRHGYCITATDVVERDSSGNVTKLRATGMPLGLMPGMGYEEKEIELDVGEAALFYSDGLVEAHDPECKMFSFPRLRALISELVAMLPAGYVITDPAELFVYESDGFTIAHARNVSVRSSAPRGGRTGAAGSRDTSRCCGSSAPGNR